MSTNAQPPKARRIRLAVLATCSAILLQVGPGLATAGATSAPEQALHQMVNQSRGGNGVGGLNLSERYSRMAHKHSTRMAQSNTLYHSCLSCRMQGRRFKAAAENVAMARSLQRAHELMMSSDGHRSNILDSRFDRVGIGVVRAGGRYWVTEIFVG